MGRTRTLRGRATFETVRRRGARKNGTVLGLNYLVLEGGRRLAAFIVPKACGIAVVRNRIKRRLREAYRHLQHDLPPGLVSVWIARPGSALRGQGELAGEVRELYERAGLLGSDGPKKTGGM